MRRSPPPPPIGRRARADGRHAARRRAGRRGVRVHAQGAPDQPRREPVSERRAARQHGLDRRRARSATPTCSRVASSAASWCAWRVASRASATQLQIEIDADRPRRGRRGRPGALPAQQLPRPRRARRLSRAPRPRGVRPGSARAARRAARRRDPSRRAAPRALHAPPRPGTGGRPGGAHHAYLGGLLEHTVAVATMAVELCTMHPRLDRDLLIAAALVHDLGKTREFTYGAEIATHPRGRAARPRRAGPAPDRARTRRQAWARSAAWSSSTACCATTAPSTLQAHASPRPRRSRSTA